MLGVCSRCGQIRECARCKTKGSRYTKKFLCGVCTIVVSSNTYEVTKDAKNKNKNSRR